MPSVSNFVGGLIGGLVGIVTTPIVADSVAVALGNGNASLTNLTGAPATLFALVPLIWVGVTVIGGAFMGGAME